MPDPPTAESILAAATDPAEVLAGFRQALADTDAANLAFAAALAAGQEAQRRAQDCAGRLRAYSDALDHLAAAAKHLERVESN